MNKRYFAVMLTLVLCLTALCGCSGQSAAEPSDTQAAAPAQEEFSSPSPSSNMEEATAAAVSTEVTELYQSQPLMMEMLVNEDCVISESNGILSITTPDGFASVAITFVPGIQNLNATAELIPAVLQQSYGAETNEVTDGYLFGARAKHCTYASTDQAGNEKQGLFAASVVNQSMYLMDAAFQTGCTDEDAALITNVFASMNILQPQSVDASTKTATYVSRYPDVKPAKSAQTTYTSVNEWVYLPYYYYGWDSDFDWTAYDSYYYEPDWNYYSDGNWWSWGWDEDYDWEFYDTYSDWYNEDYYQSYDDYYEDYDPWSDPGDYYNDGYDVWSDPGDNADEWSDPGDYYDDGYDAWSDPGDNADEWSDPGDYYDDGW